MSTLELHATVLPGHRLEVSDPSLPEGAEVRVTVSLADKPEGKFSSALDFLESLPPGPRAFATWEEYERHLQKEKDAWGR